jgi:hypothetical protein
MKASFTENDHDLPLLEIFNHFNMLLPVGTIIEINESLYVINSLMVSFDDSEVYYTVRKY